MRFTVMIESPSASFSIPKEIFTGGEWTRIKLIKCKYNMPSTATTQRRVFFINIDEVENTGYYVASGGNNIKYMGSILIAARGQVEDNWNMYNAEGERWTSFKDVKTKQLTINIYDYLGDLTTSSFLSSTHFLILEFDIE